MPRASRAEIDLRTQLQEYDEDYLLCRDLRHAWVVEGFFHKNGEVRRRLNCLRCTMQRIDAMTIAGRRIKNRYKQPEGYRIKGGVSFEAVRQEEMRRVTVFDSEEDMVQALFAPKKRSRRG